MPRRLKSVEEQVSRGDKEDTEEFREEAFSPIFRAPLLLSGRILFLKQSCHISTNHSDLANSWY